MNKPIKKNMAITAVASEEALAELRSSFPVEQGFQRVLLPRLGMVSQDQTEGKGKAMKVVTEAGTFFIESQTDEEDENGKKKWVRTEIGNQIEGIIIFQRKQLRYYDETTETYTSSAVYDTDDEIVPIFCNKAEIARGLPVELKARPEYQFEKDGKIKSKLEDNRILYIIYEDNVYQMNLRGSSMYSWMSYGRKVLPPAVLTDMTSEPMEKGSIAWNKMVFTNLRNLNAKEVAMVQEKVNEIKEGVKQEKNFYASMQSGVAKAKEELEKF